MKKTGDVKGIMFLAVRVGVVAPLLAHILRLVLTWVMLFSMEEERYQLKTRIICKGLIPSIISLGKNLKDWSRQGNTYLIT